MKPTWNDIRANWVNGNLTDTRSTIDQLTKHDLILIIKYALVDYYESCGNHTSNGSLVDLIEILNHYVKHR